MAYKQKRTTRSRKGSSSSYKRGASRYGSTRRKARKSTKRAPRDIRIVIEQPQPQPTISEDNPFANDNTPRKARF